MKVICDHSGVCSNMNCVLHLYEHEYRNTHSCELNYCRSMKCEVKCINVRKVKNWRSWVS